MTLFLVVGKDNYDSIVKGDKQTHTVKDSDYWKARLVDKKYNFIKITNGIGKDRPFILVKYNGYKKEECYVINYELIKDKKTEQDTKNEITTLKLTLEKKPYEVMITGEKTQEFRKCSTWIESRLYDKKGNPRTYDYIQFTNGYGKERPSFTAKYCGFSKEKTINKKYSNGFSVVFDECYVINYELIKDTNLLDLPIDVLNIIGNYVKEDNRNKQHLHLEPLSNVDIIKSLEFYWGKKTNHTQTLSNLTKASRRQLIEAIDKLKIPLEEIKKMDVETYTGRYNGDMWSIVIDESQKLIVISDVKHNVTHLTEGDKIGEFVIDKILKRKVRNSNIKLGWSWDMNARDFLVLFLDQKNI